MVQPPWEEFGGSSKIKNRTSCAAAAGQPPEGNRSRGSEREPQFSLHGRMSSGSQGQETACVSVTYMYVTDM